jgi:hypothetical protein
MELAARTVDERLRNSHPRDLHSRHMKITTIAILIATLACSRRQTPESRLATRRAPVADRAATSSQVVYPITVGGDVQAPVAITRVLPELHGSMSQAGPLLLAATIDRTGVVRSARVVHDGTRPKVGPLYVEALKRWRFKPGTRKGEPVDVEMMLSVNIDVR